MAASREGRARWGGSLPIVTESLSLRLFELEDVPKVFAMSQERGMREWIPDQVYADAHEAGDVVRFLIAQYDAPDAPEKAPLVLGVCLRDGGELIGHVGLSPAPEGVEVGYAIEDAHQGRGYATETVRAVAEWAIRTLGLPCLFAIVASDNAASCKVLDRAGFALSSETTRSLHGTTRLVRTYRMVGR